MDKGRINKTTTIFDLFNSHKRTHVCYAEILPCSVVPHRVKSRHHGGEVELLTEQEHIEVLKLSAPQRTFVELSLLLQGLKPEDYVISVTVHGEWKKKWHQGVVFATRTWTVATNTHIRTRSREAFNLIASLFQKEIPRELEWILLSLPP